MLSGRYELDRIQVFTENHLWQKRLSSMDIQQLANDLSKDSSTIPNCPFCTSLRIFYDYNSNGKSSFKNNLSTGLCCNSSQTFKDRYQKTGCQLNPYEFRSTLQTLCNLPPHSPTANDYIIAINSFIHLLVQGLKLLENEIISQPKASDVNKLMSFYVNNI